MIQVFYDMKKNNCIIIFLILFITFNTIAIGYGSSIQGQITDIQSSNPLIGANIILIDTQLGSASDENGNYIIPNIPIGRYTLKAMFIGYENLEKKIWIEENKSYTINIKMKTSPIYLQETRVTAEKRKGKITEAPASIEIISSNQIRRQSTTNLGVFLKGMKGVDFTASGVDNYSISTITRYITRK